MNASLVKLLTSMGTEVLVMLMKHVANLLQERVDAKGFEKEQAETVHKLCEGVECSVESEKESK